MIIFIFNLDMLVIMITEQYLFSCEKKCDIVIDKFHDLNLYK